MTRMLITAATRLLRGDLSLRMVARREDVVDWTCDRTLQSFSFTDAEMATMIAEGTASFRMPGAIPPAVLPDPTELTSSSLAEAARKVEYVESLRSIGHRPSVEDATATIKKTAERLGEAIPPSNRSVERWSKRAGEPPNVLRLVARHDAKGNRGPRVTDLQRSVIDAMIDRYYMQRARISLKALVGLVRDEIRVRNETLSGDHQMKVPKRAAVESVLADRDPFEIAKARYGPAHAEQMLGAVHRQVDPEAPLDKVELDHTMADIFVIRDEDGLPLGRPTIGYAIDRCTRMPLGLYIGFEPPSVLTVMQILKHAIFPKTYIDRLVGEGEWDLKHRWEAWGMPRMLMLDRATENLGHDLRRSAHELGIVELAFAATRKGRHKGVVERHFRALNTQLLHQTRGTSFSNTIQRADYDPAENAVLTLSDLQLMVHRYFVDIFPHDVHSGLRDIPARAWRMLIDKHPADPPKPIEEMIHLFTRTTTRTLRRSGIEIFNMEYSSPSLHAVRTSPDFLKASPDRTVLVRYDPADISQLWIRLPHTGTYLKVPPGPRWVDYATGKSEWEHDAINEHGRLDLKAAIDPDALEESRRKLLDEQISAGKRRTATRKSRARLDGHGRTSPAGDDPSTSPAGSAASKAAARRKPKAANDTSANPPPQLPPQPRPAPSRPGVRRISFDGES